jgi:hypothetical protein
MVAPQFVAGTIENVEMALDGSHEAQYGFTESGFPRSVRANDADEFTCVDGKTNILKRNDAGKPKRRVVEPNDRLVEVWHETRYSFWR